MPALQELFNASIPLANGGHADGRKAGAEIPLSTRDFWSAVAVRDKSDPWRTFAPDDTTQQDRE